MASTGPTGFSIVIPTWNGLDLLQRFLPSVIEAAQFYRLTTSAEAEIIIVDDGSNDGTVDWLAANYSSTVRVISKPSNQGFAAACNAGIDRATYPLIFLLNNDVRVERDVLTHLAPHFSNPEVFAVTCKALTPESGEFTSGGKIGRFRKGFWRIHENYDVDQRETEGQVTEYYSILAGGGFSAFDAKKLRRLGGFDEMLSPFYWEDVELSLRAWHRGWKILYEPKAVVYHEASRTITPRFPRRRIRLINERNRLLIHWVHLDQKKWLVEHFFVVLALVLASLLKLDLTFLQALGLALRELPAVLQRRRRERLERKLTGRQIEDIFSRLL